MDLIRQFVDLLLHLDQHLGESIAQYQEWTYAIAFAVIFLEALPLLTPLLPGGALLLAAGSFAARGSLSMPPLVASLALASVFGDTVNYWTGRWLGPHLFRKHGARFFDHRNIERAHVFFARYGPATLLIARFLPFIRTLAPILAGVGTMPYRRFFLFNAAGGVAWTLVFLYLGYFFGHIPWVRNHMTLVILATVLLPALPVAIGIIRRRRHRRTAP